MWQRTRRYQGSHVLRAITILLAGILIAGCASTFSADVTQFQQWPFNAQGERYRIVAGPGQTNNLEFQAVADTVRAAMGPTGLVEATAGAPARFDVHLGYSNPVTQTWVQRYNDPYLYDGWGFGPYFGGYYGSFPGWGAGIYMSPSVSTVPVNVYQNTLTVTINDMQNQGQEVYRSTAVNVSSTDNLAQALPYLAQAVFDSFPGNNGQTRVVKYQLD